VGFEEERIEAPGDPSVTLVWFLACLAWESM
jgi:hypothetical protein